MRSPVALSLALFSATSVIAHAQDQTVSVGPWAIATSTKAEKFDSCTMSRSTNDLDITFVRTRDGLLLLLDSTKWKLERGKAYEVTLLAGFAIGPDKGAGRSQKCDDRSVRPAAQ